jgi:CBS domain containing-hemolysin-like protein
MEVPLGSLFILAGLLSAFFSSILNSISRDAITGLIDENYKSAQRLQYLKTEFNFAVNQFVIVELIAYFAGIILLTTTIVGTYGKGLPLLYFGAGFTIVTLTLRYTLKSIGEKHADELMRISAPFISFFSYLASPLSLLYSKLNSAIIGSPNDEAGREEISALVESAREEGSLDADEYRILKNIMNFSEVYVSDVMTPRTVIFSLEAGTTVKDAIKKPDIQMHSRFPVWEGESIDDGVAGYVMSKDVLQAALNGKTATKLYDFVREVYFIPESATLDIALEKFLNRRQHMFMVVDEYGGIEGLITMEDVLETILGAEIVDEVDKVVDLRQLAKQRRDNRIATMS